MKSIIIIPIIVILLLFNFLHSLELKAVGGDQENLQGEDGGGVGHLLDNSYDCDSIATTVVSSKRTRYSYRRLVSCVLSQHALLHPRDTYTAIYKECGKFGYSLAESIKVEILQSIFCYFEINNRLREGSNKAIDKVDIAVGAKEYLLELVTLTYLNGRLHLYLNNNLNRVKKHMTSGEWFPAYLRAAVVCRQLITVFFLWIYIVRDSFWTYLHSVNGPFISRYPVEHLCPYINHMLPGLGSILPDDEVTQLIDNLQFDI